MANLTPGPVPEGYSASQDHTYLATVSFDFFEDWLASLRVLCSPPLYAHFIEYAGFSNDVSIGTQQRVTHDQIVSLYQHVVEVTGDEMMGLWSRPIRTGALKYICEIVADASSIRTALYRLSQFWKLLLDDYAMEMVENQSSIRIEIRPRMAGLVVNRFGHVLLLKLVHGIASWLARRELPVLQIGFAFGRPSFAEDYSILFPASVSFEEPCSFISFGQDIGRLAVERQFADIHEFLVRAPRDWIFTSYNEHAIQLKLREFLHASPFLQLSLEDAASRLNMAPRTLMRKLAAENLSFQAIKDGVRRDFAIRDLARTTKSLALISHAIGFSSVAAFHRAFKHWTGLTPAAYRRQSRGAILREGRPAPPPTIATV